MLSTLRGESVDRGRALRGEGLGDPGFRQPRGAAESMATTVARGRLRACLWSEDSTVGVNS